MAEEITSLKLKIDVQSVDEANKKLDDFSKKAEKAVSATDEFESSQKTVKSSLSRTAKEVNEVHRRIAEYRKNLTVNTNSAKKFAESSDKLYVSFRDQIDSLKDVNTASKDLVRIRKTLTKTYKDGQIDINNYSQLLSDIAIKQKEVTAAENIASKAKTDFLNKLKAQVATQNLSKEQLLRYQAAQLGVSSSADVYIRKLTQATKETKKLGTASLATKHQLATMTTQMMRGNFSGLQTSSMSMIMKNGLGNTFGSLLTSLNPVNLGISALVGFLGSMIPKLFESESATDKLAAAQERLNRALSTDKKTGLTFLSEEMMLLLKKSPTLVKALLKNTERDAITAISSVSNKFKGSFKTLTDGFTDFAKSANSMGLNLSIDLDSVLDDIQKIKASGRDLNDTFKALDLNEMQVLRNIEDKASSLASGFNITQEEAKNLLIDLSAIKTETDSIKAEEKIQQLIEKVSQLYITTGSNNNNFASFIDGLQAIATEADEATAKLKVLRLFTDPTQATDPKKSPFYQYAQMAMTNRQLADAEVAAMKDAAEEANKIFKSGQKGYVSKDDIIKAEAAIRARYDKKGGGKSLASNLLHTSQQQEISLKNQLQALREQSLTVNTITSERKKYFDLQAQIQVLENTGNKSKLSAQEKYVLAHKEALLAQYAKNAALGDEIAQYETATKALLKMQEYATNLSAKAKATQATFGMTSKNTNRYNEMSELDAQRDIALKGTTNPNEIAKVTEEYNKAKQALQQSWQQEDINQADWFSGLKVGINEFSDASRNMFDAFRDLGQQTIGSVTQSLTEFVTTGKMNFKSLTKSIITNIIEIINKLLIAQAIQSSMKWFGMGGAGAATGGLQQAHNGGLIRGYATGGDVGYSAKPGGFTGHGNKYKPAGVVHKGEFVFTKEATKRLGVDNLYALMNDAQRGYANGGGVNLGHSSPVAIARKSSGSTSAVNVTANVTVIMPPDNDTSGVKSNANTEAAKTQFGAMIQKEINEMFKKSVSPGGELYNIMKSMR